VASPQQAADARGATERRGHLHTADSAHGRIAAAGRDAHPTVIFSCSLTGTVLATGAALGELSGAVHAEVVGAPTRLLLQPSSHVRLQQVLRAARGGATTGSATFRFRQARGPGVEVPGTWSVLTGTSADASQLVFVSAGSSAGRLARRKLRMQEAFGRLSRDVAVVADAHGTLRYVSPALGTLFGYDTSAVVPWDIWSYIHADDVARARTVYGAVVDGDGPQTSTLRIRAAAGDWRWVELVAVNLLDDEAVGGIVCAVHDITDEVRDYESLQASEEMFRAIADSSEEGIWAVSATAGTLYANARMAAILGVTVERAYDFDLMCAMHPELAAGVHDRLRTRLDRGSERYEVTYAHPDGHERRLLVSAVPLFAEDGTHDGSLAVVTDVTDARRADQELRAAALQDGLTRLPNRTLLVDQLTHALARVRSSTAVLLVDLDHFSMVNDSRGHGVGDQLLIGVGTRLREAVADHQTVARFGADEFVILCEDADDDRAHAIARELLQALAEPFHIDGAPVHVAASIGVAVAPAHPALSATELLRQADTALHAAKSGGRGRVQGFDQTLGTDVEHRYALSADLRAALADGDLRLEYQPIVDLRWGVVVGVEALARWTHPDRGPVPPSDFVPVAELTGLAPELDRWVIRQALQDMAALRAVGVVPDDAYVAVNLSACNLTDSFVFDDLLTWTEAAGLPATQVVLEITETAIMQNTDVAVRLLRRLRDQGFRVAMDDFGTGYSSLAHLRDLPISALKIDRSFVADITDEQGALAIVASIVDLARGVGVAVIAEGVETPEQSALLQRLGCVTAQGWLWSPAVPITALLSGREWMTHAATADEPSATAT
jgi:diguanylate cyclase (GGDEF)-like protein/PAS domain S-box-containing protein